MKIALPVTVQSAAECTLKPSSVELDENIKKKDEEPTQNNKIHVVIQDLYNLTYKILSLPRIMTLFSVTRIT